MLKLEGGAGLIIERQCYSLKEEYAENLDALLDDLLDYHNVLKGYLIDNENNEYYTSREYLDIVKESYRLKQTKHLNANLDSNFSTTSQLTSSVASAFFKCEAAGAARACPASRTWRMPRDTSRRAQTPVQPDAAAA